MRRRADLLLMTLALGLMSPTVSAEARATTEAPPAAATSVGPALGLRPTGRLVSMSTWDWHLDLMVGPVFESPEVTWAFAGRMRGGALWVRDVVYWQLGATFEVSTRQSPSVGLQGEVMHGTSGWWAQVGAGVDFASKVGASLSTGWSIFGVEGQLRQADAQPVVWTLLAKIHLPLRLFFPLPVAEPPKGSPSR